MGGGQQGDGQRSAVDGGDGGNEKVGPLLLPSAPAWSTRRGP